MRECEMKITLFLFLLAAIPMLTAATCFAEDIPVPVDDKDPVPPQAAISRDGIYLPEALLADTRATMPDESAPAVETNRAEESETDSTAQF